MHIIDCDAEPFIPEGFTLLSHEKGGTIEWEPSTEQERYCHLFNQRFNTNVLWFLWEHQHLIPDSWGKREWWRWGYGPDSYFRGTCYLSPHRHVSHLCLYRAPDGSWNWGYQWLDY